MNSKAIVLVLYIFVGLLFIGLSLPMIMRKVPPNPIYGFRVAKTMNNPDIWYKANEYSGWTMLWAGVVTVIGAFVLKFLSIFDVKVYTIACVTLMSVSLVISLILSFIYLRSL